MAQHERCPRCGGESIKDRDGVVRCAKCHAYIASPDMVPTYSGADYVTVVRRIAEDSVTTTDPDERLDAIEQALHQLKRHYELQAHRDWRQVWITECLHHADACAEVVECIKREREAAKRR